jgi:hypothetical protein
MNKTQALLLGMVAVLIIGAYLFENQNSASFTVYPVLCKDWANNPPAVEDFANCHEPYAYAREVFTLNESKNQITETSPDNSSFYTLNSCTIQDNEHWGCGQSYDAFGAVSPSRSGSNFSENGYAGSPIDTIFVTQTQWNSVNNGAVGS